MFSIMRHVVEEVLSRVDEPASTYSRWMKSCIVFNASDCIYHFPIDLGPNGYPFGSKSIGKW